MCDTFYVKTEQSAFFGKNSDRSCNEPNLTVYIGKRQTTEQEVKLTYITISQVAETNAMILVKPSWTYGAEMGINQYGVCIGNEALFTKSKEKKEPSIIGMDYVRLALERGNSAKNCCDVIIDLLSKYGQGGNCGFDKNFFYDNSYLIADGDTAYILQTIGREYLLEEITQQGNISNRISLGDKKFFKQNSDFLFTAFSGSLNRQTAVENSCSNVSNLFQAFDVLRQHNSAHNDKLWQKGSVSSVCMHQSVLGDQTTGSMVVQLGQPVIWVTGCSLPCVSVFKPVCFASPYAPCFENHQRSLTYWLQREYLTRAISAGLIDISNYKNKVLQLQDSFVSDYAKVNLSNVTALAEFCTACHYAEQKLIDSFASQIDQVKQGKVKTNLMWKGKNKRLGKNVFYGNLVDRKL